MKTLKIFTLIMAATIFLGAAEALAVTDTESLTINATVASKAKLTLGESTINFPDADPDSVSSISANENAVSVEVKARTSSGGSVTLVVQAAAADLVDGSKTIPIGNVTWTAAGDGFVGGTMDNVTPQSAGSWTGSGTRSSTFSYFLANSWSYQPGAYTQTVTYTLTAP